MMKPGRLPGVADLPKLGAAQLRAIHKELFGVAPQVVNCQHLRRKIAWHLQTARDGSLPESVRQHAIAIARETELRSRIGENLSRRRAEIPLNQTVAAKVIQTRDARLPMPGCLIVKDYKGNTIVVKVLDSGFEYDGRRFTSLSAIAGEITGTRWNGFLFFGLEKGARHAK
jgi:hypothetical protein